MSGGRSSSCARVATDDTKGDTLTSNIDRLRERVAAKDALDQLALAVYDLEYPTDGERKGRRRRFRNAVLQLPEGGVEMAWDDDMLTIEQYHWACQVRRDAGLAP